MYNVIVFLLFLLMHNNLHQVLVPIAVSIHISDMEVENAQTATLPKAMDDVISTLFISPSKSGWLLLLTLSTLMHLLLLYLMLLLCLFLHHRSCCVYLGG